MAAGSEPVISVRGLVKRASRTSGLRPAGGWDIS